MERRIKQQRLIMSIFSLVDAFPFPSPLLLLLWGSFQYYSEDGGPTAGDLALTGQILVLGMCAACARDVGHQGITYDTWPPSNTYWFSRGFQKLEEGHAEWESNQLACSCKATSLSEPFSFSYQPLPSLTHA